MINSNPVYVSIPQLQLAVEFLKSLIRIMQERIIRLLLRTENCMQSEGEPTIRLQNIRMFGKPCSMIFKSFYLYQSGSMANGYYNIVGYRDICNKKGL